MTVHLSRRRHLEDPLDFISKTEALEDAVASIVQTFAVQLGMTLEPDGPPGAPDPHEVLFGGTLALTNDEVNFQFACTYSADVAQLLTRAMFAMEADAATPMTDMADALNEIPNVAAGVWKAKREKSMGERYQLGLPIFLKGHSWIKFFPRGVNGIAQKLSGPDGLSLQVVLIWQYGINAGGKQLMTTNTRESTEVEGNCVPKQVLQEAVQAVVDTCRIQMDLNLEVDPNPSDPREAEVEFGSSIALTSENGGWNLAVMGNRKSGEALTRNLFAMADDEHPEMEDMADGLGEIANVAAGVMKSSRAAAGQKVQLGLPLFMEGRSCFEFFASGIRGMAQTVRGENDLEVHVILIWQER